jgi:hypothetical protein
MNARFSALLMACLAGLAFAGPVLAGPRFPDGEWLAARDNRDPARQEERDARKSRKQADRKPAQRGAEEDRTRGYGYGYERRNPQPRQDGAERR